MGSNPINLYKPGQPSDGTSILRQNSSCTKAGQVVDTNALLKSVHNDMVNVEKGGQWLLSCYAPFREKARFPGFEDHSFEEIRNGFYTANANGTLNQYVQQLEAARQDIMMKCRLLQQPTPEIIHLLEMIYNTPANQGDASQFGQRPFAPSTSTTMFGAPAQTQAGIFGGQPALSNNVFGGVSSNSPFLGQSNAFAPQAAAPAPTFSQMQSPFNPSNPMQIQAQASTFSFAPQAQQNFAGQSQFPPRSQSFTGSLFAGQMNPAAPSGSIFGGAQPTTPFQAPPVNSFFGPLEATTQMSVQDVPQPAQFPPTFGTNVFQSAAANISISTFYSSPNELTNEEMDQYNSNVFSSGCIPEAPPPNVS